MEHLGNTPTSQSGHPSENQLPETESSRSRSENARLTSRLGEMALRLNSVISSAKEHSPIDAVSSRLQTVIAERLSFDTDDMKKNNENISKFYRLVRNGKLSLDNELVAQKYIGLQFDHFSYGPAGNIEAMQKLYAAGISQEKVAHYIVDNYIKQSMLPESKQPTHRTTFSLGDIYYATKDLKDPELMTRLKKDLNERNIPKVFTDLVLEESWIYSKKEEELWDRAREELDDRRRGAKLLQKLGLESPIHQDLSTLFRYESGLHLDKNKQVAIRQLATYNVGLIDESDVDNLYRMAFAHRYEPFALPSSQLGPIGRRTGKRITLEDLDDGATKYRYSISPDLPTSRDDDFVEFYKSHIETLDELLDESQKGNSVSILLAREHFLQSEEEKDSEYEEIFEYFKTHPDYLKDKDRGLMITLANSRHPEEEHQGFRSYIRSLGPMTLSRHFDENGVTLEFYVDNLCNIQSHPDPSNIFDCFGLTLDEKQKKILEIGSTIKSTDFKTLFRDYVLQNYDNLNLDNLNLIPSISKRIISSNAEELASHAIEFIHVILASGLKEDSLFDAVSQIEDIFIHNNLPYVGKNFITFCTLYPEGQNHPVSRVMSRGALRDLPESSILHSKKAVIFNDLLKASMYSGNRDLKKYLTDLKRGADLADRVVSGQNDYSDEDIEILRNYSNHLMTLYNNTVAGKKDPVKLSSDPVKDVREFSRLFGPTSRYDVPDRIVRSFAYGLGIKSYDEMVEKMNSAIAETDARNRAAAKANHFTLESGDIIKSTSIEYLGAILQNGSVSKEFLNGQASSDSTPLDTDVNILPEGLSGNISEGVDKKNDIANFGAMHCMMVLKSDASSGRHRFQMEDEDASYDQNRYELWHNDGDNYGIRVGFPSAEIDYLIYDDLGGAHHEDLEQMKFEVVRNGFYIPIVDKKTGQLVFTPEEYDTSREKMRGLSEYGDEPFRFADEAAWRSNNETLVDSLDIPSYILPDGSTIPGVRELASQYAANREAVGRKRTAIIEQVIAPVLTEMGLSYKEHLDGDLTPGIAEFIDTGSTGRLSNIPGDGDFDFMMKLDRDIFESSERMNRLRQLFADRLGNQFLGSNVRAKDVQLDGLEAPVDIDITFSQRTNKVRYSTDVALTQQYAAAESADPEKIAQLKANIVFAKEFLKGIEAYKSFHAATPQGGLGGVGVENWILQNGGSFIAAARDFMRVAKTCESFDAFKEKYAIWDYGENHKNGKHDNFVVSNMNQEGFVRMKTALADFLSAQEITY